jgi:hypothetical protein
MQRLGNSRDQGLGRQGPVEHPVPSRTRKVQESCAHAFVKRVVFGLDTVGTLGARAHPRSCDSQRDVEDEDEVGLEPSGSRVADGAQQFQADATPVALVRERGIDEPVAENDPPSRQCRTNHLRDVLGAGGVDEQAFRERRDRDGVIQEESANSIADGRSSRLPRHHRLAPIAFQALCQAAKEGTLAASLDPLYRDEHAAVFDAAGSHLIWEPLVLGDLIGWFLRRAADRRQYKRRSGQFHLWWQAGTADDSQMRPGLGLEISPNGLLFIIPDRIAAEEYNLVLRIQDRKIPVRVRNVHAEEIVHQGKTWQRYAVEFAGIAADDWDRVVRYVNGEAEVDDRRRMQNQEMSRQTDDAYRLLPLAIQQKIVDMLVSKRRIDAPNPGQTPLLKLFYSGLVERPGKKPAHRINVHSRVTINGELTAYDTRFIVDDDGNVSFAP